MDHYESLFVFNLDRESRTTTWPECRMTSLDREFNVVRVMIEATNDHQVLQAAGDKEFARINETEITGAQKWSFTSAGKMHAECLFSEFRFTPVTLSDTPSRNPDLSHLTRRTLDVTVRINNTDHLRAQISAAANQ